MEDNKENIEKKEKKVIAGSKVKVSTVAVVSVLCAIFLIICIFFISVFGARAYDTDGTNFSFYNLKSKLYTTMIVSAMPDTITGNDNGKDVTFYIEVNDDYNSETDDPVEQYRVYYYNDEGEKLVATEGIYQGSTEKMYPLVGFFIAGMNSLKKLKVIAIVIAVILGMITLGLLGYLIYLIWAINQDRKFSQSYQLKKKLKKEQKALEKENKKKEE